MSKSKSRHLADLIGSDGDIKDDKMDRAAIPQSVLDSRAAARAAIVEVSNE